MNKRFFLVFSVASAIFFNFLLSLYAIVSPFKIDFVKLSGRKKSQRLLFVIKNNLFLYVANCLSQFIFSLIISDNIREFLPIKNEGWRRWVERLVLFVLVCFSEIGTRLVATKMFGEKLILNKFFLYPAYALTKLFSRLGFFLNHNPKKKIFFNTEKEINLFIKNSVNEKILEPEEARLVKSALHFDDLRVDKYLVPWKKVIFLTTDMTYPQIQKIYLEHFFSNYPVLNKEKKVIGIFNYPVFAWLQSKNKLIEWQNNVNESIIVSPQTKLSEVFRRLQKESCQMAVIQLKEKKIGIITKKDVLGFLVGKIHDEKDLLVFPSKHLRTISRRAAPK